MKVLFIDNEKLIIQLKPVLIWLFGSIFFISGLFIMVLVGKYSQLTCNRDANESGTCILTERGIIGLKAKSFPVEELAGARVDESQDSEGDYTYRVCVHTKSEDIALNSVWTSGYNNKNSIANNINAFVRDPDKLELFVEQDERLMPIIMGLIFGAVGGGIVLLTAQVTLFFDRHHNKLTILRKSLIRKKVELYFLDQLKGANIAESSDSDGGTTYRVELILSEGKNIPITSYYSTGLADKQKLATQINNFLGIKNQSG